MRFAFFGGSFDPPHRGHLHIALTACARLQLDQVLLAPVGRQPLKSHHPAPFADRLAMLALLAAPYPQLAASPMDAPQPDHRPNYTADTLARLQPTLPPGAELFFLAGADSFLTLHAWHRPEALLRPAAQRGLLTGWILAARPGFPLASLSGALPPGYTLDPEPAGSGENPAPGLEPSPFPSFQNAPGPVLTRHILDPAGSPATPLYLLPDLDDRSTATRIREAFADGQPAPHLTPEISAYIEAHGLYRQQGRVLR